MPVSPICLVADGVGSFGATTNGVDVTTGATISIKLASTTDVTQWFLQVIGTDELSTNPVLSSVNVTTHEVATPGTTVTFTMPAARGRALLFKSTTAGTGGPSVATFAIYTLTLLGKRAGAVGEKRETNQNFGWITIFNPVIREGAPALLYDDGLVSPTIGAVSIQDAIDYLKANSATPFAVTSFAGGSLRELGQSLVTPAFTATYQSGTPTTATLTDSDGTAPKNVTSTPTAFSSNATFVKSTYGQNVVFTLTAVKGATTSIATTTWTWVQKVFWDVSSSGGAYNEAFIEGLTNSALASARDRTFTVTAGASQKIYYAFRTAYGTPTFSVGGIEGGFELIASAVSVTNAFGATETYDVWRSVQSNLGNTTVTVT